MIREFGEYKMDNMERQEIIKTREAIIGQFGWGHLHDLGIHNVDPELDDVYEEKIWEIKDGIWHGIDKVTGYTAETLNTNKG